MGDPVYLELSFSPQTDPKKHYGDQYYDSKRVVLSETRYPPGNSIYRVITHAPVSGCLVAGIYLHKSYMYGFNSVLQKGCVVTVYFWVEDTNLATPLLVLAETETTSDYYYFSSYDHNWTATPLVTPDNLLESLDINNCNRNHAHTIDLAVRDGDACHACYGTKFVVAIETNPLDRSYSRTTYHISEPEQYRIARFKEGHTEMPTIRWSENQSWVRTYSYSKKPNIPLLLYILGQPKVGRKWYMRSACNLNTWTDITNWHESILPHYTEIEQYKDKLLRLLAMAYAPSITFDLSRGPTGDYCSYTDSLSGETVEIEKRLEGKYVRLVHTVKNEETFKVGGVTHGDVKTDGVHTTDEVNSMSVFYWSLDYDYQSPLFIELEKYDKYEYYASDRYGSWKKKDHGDPKMTDNLLNSFLDSQNCLRNHAHQMNMNRDKTTCTCPCGISMQFLTKHTDNEPNFWKLTGFGSIAGLLDKGYYQTGIPSLKNVKDVFVYFAPTTTGIPLLVCLSSASTDKERDYTTVTWCRRDSEDSNNWSLGLGLPYIPDAYPDVMTEMLENFPKTTVAVDTGKNFYSELKIDNLGYYYETTSLTGKERVTVHVTITEDFLPDLGDYCRITHRPQDAAITALKNGDMVFTGFSDLCNYSSASIYYWTVDDTRTTPLLIQLGDYYYTTKNGTDWTRDPTVLLTNLSETLDRHNCLTNDTHHVDLARTTDPTKDTLYKCLSCGITNITLKCVKSPNVPECTYYEHRVDGRSVAKYFIGSTHQDGLPPTDTVNTLHVYLNVNGVTNGPVLVHIPIDDKTEESLSAGWFERVPNTGDSWFQEPTLYDREDPVSESVRRAVIKASVKTLDIDIGKETDTTLGEVKVALDKYTGPYRPITFSPKDAKIGRVKFRDQVQLGFPLLSTYPSLTAYYWTLDVDLNNPLTVGLGDGNEYYSRRDGNTWHNDGLLSTPTLLTERLDLYNCLKNGSHIIDISPIDAKTLTEDKSDYPCPSCAHKVSVTMTHISKYILSTHTVNDYSISKFRDGGIDQTGLPSLKNLKNAYVYHYSQVGGKALLIWLPSLTTVDKNAKPRKLLEDIYRRTTIFSNDWIQLSPTLVGDVNSTLEFEESKILELLQAVDNDSLKTDKLA